MPSSPVSPLTVLLIIDHSSLKENPAFRSPSIICSTKAFSLTKRLIKYCTLSSKSGLKVINIQPVIPLLSGKLITRTIIPFVWMPDYYTEDEFFFKGLSDITFTAFYVPSSGSTMWGVGPVLDIPTGGSKRGSNKWNIGPSVVVLAQPGDWTLGLLANNVWSFEGSSQAADVNKGLI